MAILCFDGAIGAESFAAVVFATVGDGGLTLSVSHRLRSHMANWAGPTFVADDSYEAASPRLSGNPRLSGACYQFFDWAIWSMPEASCAIARGRAPDPVESDIWASGAANAAELAASA
jgi:hypothetical protein